MFLYITKVLRFFDTSTCTVACTHILCVHRGTEVMALGLAAAIHVNDLIERIVAAFLLD